MIGPPLALAIASVGKFLHTALEGLLNLFAKARITDNTTSLCSDPQFGPLFCILGRGKKCRIALATMFFIVSQT